MTTCPTCGSATAPGVLAPDRKVPGAGNLSPARQQAMAEVERRFGARNGHGSADMTTIPGRR